MSYRTFKHLLGETSLERKCRFIFGGGILLLVTISFYWYGRKTESLVMGQNTEAARMLVHPVLYNIHFNEIDSGKYFGTLPDDLLQGKISRDDGPQFEYETLSPQALEPAPPDADNETATGSKKRRDLDDFEREALTNFIRAAKNEKAYAKAGSPNLRGLKFSDGTDKFFAEVTSDRKSYRYIQAVAYRENCISCHSSRQPNGKYNLLESGDFAGAVVIKLPMERVRKSIHQNRAVLISAALVTAILAMFSSYAIVRYVIVKPVKHLREVSEAIAAGKLTIRSHIHTGDDFEELSHAFNRMLHSLVAMQQELRDVNADLDRKVDELAQANLALFEMNRLKSDFLATMSHELRTPLNSIIGFSEVLSSSDQLSERHRKFSTNILNSGRMLLGLINDILDLAKIESGKMEIRVEDFSIRDICEALSSIMMAPAEKKNIDLDCEIDESIPLLRQDPGKIRQIVYNLLSNAVKFTPEGGRVILRAFVEGKNFVIQVEDTGIGIAPEDQERVFEKFRQLNQPAGEGVLVREHQGTGLGLSIVRELCKLLGGDVDLVSEPGLGSTFTVTLPQQLQGGRRFEVNLYRQDIDLSKARRIEAYPRTHNGSRALSWRNV